MRAAGESLPAQTQPRARVAQLRDVRRPLQRLRAEGRGVALVDGRLEGGRGDVAVEHARVGVVEDRRLDAALEQRRRLAHEVLVERVLRGDEDREAVLAAAGASPLLAEARDRAREADRDRAVEVADVDAELERVGRRDAEQLALDEPPLDLAPLLRRVAGAVRREPPRRSPRRADRWRSGGSARPTCGSSRSRSCAGRGRRARRAAATPRRARSRAARARRRAAAGSRARSSARRAARASSSTTVASSPVSACASSPAFAIVAEASRNCGSAP